MWVAKYYLSLQHSYLLIDLSEERRPSSWRWGSISWWCGSWDTWRSVNIHRPFSVFIMFLFRSCLQFGGTVYSSFKKSQALFTKAMSLSLVLLNGSYFLWYLPLSNLPHQFLIPIYSQTLYKWLIINGKQLFIKSLKFILN